jgi:diguanylate cyclase (GGDEF)-like protein
LADPRASLINIRKLKVLAINKQRCVSRLIHKLALLRGSILLVLMWPITCLALGLFLWGATLSKVNVEKRLLNENALKDATFLSAAYAQHLSNAVEQVDQITLLVKHQWEHSKDKSFTLEDSFQIHSFPGSRHLFVNLIDANGGTVTRSLSTGRRNYIADRDYFIFQKAAHANVLFVGQPVTSRSTGKTVIHFSRRLQKPNGAFDGVVVVSVEPIFFSSFNGVKELGKAGVLAMIGKDGRLRTSTTGSDTGKSAPAPLASIPPFEGQQGSTLMPGAPWFTDNHARFVGWSALDSHPFIAMVGLSEDELYAPYLRTWGTYKVYAFVGSLFLIFSALVGVFFSSRLAWTAHRAGKIREEYGIATEGGNDGFFLWRALRDKNGLPVDFEIADCNERGAGFYELDKAQLLGTRISEFYEDKTLFERLMETYRHAMEAGFYEDEYRVPAESPFKEDWLHRKLVRSNLGLAVTIRDISKAKAHERELERLANADELTGMPNRNWFVHFLPAAIERAKSSGTKIGILFIDLDNFKDINNTFGHSVGDKLLVEASLRLQSVMRPTDSAVRFGGDEFIIVLEDVARESKPTALASRIVDAFNQPFELPTGKHVISASIGISLFPRDGEDVETLIKNADIAMYATKGAGKGHFRFFDPQLSIQMKQRLETEQALLRALELDQFVLYYQPRVSTATGELCGMEALVRWIHPERGLVPPLEFIPLAENTGLILKLGGVVMAKACAQLAAWRHQGLPLVPVSINVSAKQFNQGDIQQLLESHLARHDVPPTLLEIEITESVMVGEHAEIVDQLAAIRKFGVKVLVDDFGTGYSSLSQLQRLDMDVLKIDRAFTAELETKEGEILFTAIMSMAHALGMTVVAEGVETVEQVRILQGLSCDEIQGYFISKPLPANELPALMQKRILLSPELRVTA